mgnify:CR=1 FL=1
MAAGYDRSRTRAYATTWETNGESVTLYSTMSVAAVALQRVLDMEAQWNISAAGEITVTMQVKKNMEFPSSKVWASAIFKGRI